MGQFQFSFDKGQRPNETASMYGRILLAENSLRRWCQPSIRRHPEIVSIYGTVSILGTISIWIWTRLHWSIILLLGHLCHTFGTLLNLDWRDNLDFKEKMQPIWTSHFGLSRLGNTFGMDIVRMYWILKNVSYTIYSRASTYGTNRQHEFVP